MWQQLPPNIHLNKTDKPHRQTQKRQIMSNPDNDSSTPPILTETMAQLLLNQRHWREAIDIYRKLALQNPEKAEAYQKEITQIKGYFKPQINPEALKKRRRTKQKIVRLKNLLKVVEKQQTSICKQRSS